VLRVYGLAMKLNDSGLANDFVIALAALLHDVDDPKISQDTHHARDFLTQFCPEVMDKVMDIIENMSFSSHQKGKSVSTLEGQIVQDADRLDALGAIGIARTFAYSGYVKRPIYLGKQDDDSAIAHFYQKLFKLPGLLNTDPAKAMAEERILFMKQYLDMFYKEWLD
ncbi:MAG TPA: HD domain-containing protein, partial [Bacillota bacterium]|nr:HD domain-containing protein [Bacillota bacterium]